LMHRPEVAAAGIAIARAGRARSLAKRTYWPDVTIGAQYIQVGERDDIQIDRNGRDVFQLSAAINIPIWAGGRRAAVEQADADAARARNEKTGWEASVRNQVRDAHVRVRTAAERVALHRDVIIPQAEQTFGASESAYQTGELSFLDLLDSERMLLSARKKYFEVLADYGLQLATLEKSLGAALDEIR
jgi:cobalt-zinc-cadmium efflux system outer membrane protein